MSNTQLPQDITDKLNLKLSRHPDPLTLDWKWLRDRWVAYETKTGRSFTIVAFEEGYVVAETKTVSIGVGFNAI